MPRARVVNNIALKRTVVAATPNYRQLIVVSTITVQFTVTHRARYSRYTDSSLSDLKWTSIRQVRAAHR